MSTNHCGFGPKPVVGALSGLCSAA